MKDLQQSEEEKEIIDRGPLQDSHAELHILNGSGDEDLITLLIGLDKEAGEHHFCAVVVGDIASGNLGLNPLPDEALKGPGMHFFVCPCSRRFTRGQ